MAHAPLADYRVPQAVEIAYLCTVIFGGQLLIPILLVLCWVRGISRHPTLLNFLGSWSLYSISTCFLLYAGHGFDAHPPEVLCLVQVPLQQAAFLVVAFSAISLVIQLLVTLPKSTMRSTESSIRDALLLAFPYVGGGVYLAVFFSINANAPSSTAVERGRVTCRFVDSPDTAFFSSFAPITVGVVLILCLFMSLWMLSRTVKRLANIGNWTLKDGLKIAPQSPWLPILARFSRFCIYATLMILACAVVAATPQGIGRYFVEWYTATLPIAAFVIFAPWTSRKRANASPTKTISLPFMSPTATLVGHEWPEHKEKAKQGSPESFFADEYFDVAITPVRPPTRPESIFRPNPNATAPPHLQPQAWNAYGFQPHPAPILQQPRRPSRPEHNPYTTHVPPVSKWDNRI